MRWNLVESPHQQPATEAEECRGYRQGPQACPAAEAHCIGHGEQAQAHEDVCLQAWGGGVWMPALSCEEVGASQGPEELA